MTSFFHAYDLRGKHPEQIGEEEAERVGRALGTFLDADEILVGRDGRNHAEKVEEAFVEGLLSTGTAVLDAGMVPTPVVYREAYEREVPSAVVTASHNPPEYTGFKFMHGDGRAMSRDSGMREIQEIYEAGDFQEGKADRRTVDAVSGYIEWLSDSFSAEGLSVAVDYGNGVAASIGERLFEALGCDHRGVCDTVDGSFPNHLPDPTDSEAQQHLEERMDGEDLGILIDGDGDRAGFVVDGEYVPEDQVLALFSEHLLGEGGAVVHDLRASKLVRERIEDAGGTAVESRVGHTFISELIYKRGDVVFAGELSGHYYFPSLDAPYDDGLMAAALMCELAANGEIDRLEEYPDYPVSPELRIDCPEEAKEAVVEDVSERFSDLPQTTKDGVKVEFDRGWALVRPSNTEPKMSVRCEADTEEALDSILEKVEGAVRDAIESRSQGL